MDFRVSLMSMDREELIKLAIAQMAETEPLRKRLEELERKGAMQDNLRAGFGGLMSPNSRFPGSIGHNQWSSWLHQMHSQTALTFLMHLRLGG